VAASDQGALGRAALDHWRAGRFEDARGVCDEMLRRAPRDPVALVLAARIAAAMGDPARGVGHAKRAMAVAPEAAEPLFLTCALLLRLGDAAASKLLPRLEQHPDFAPGWVEIGQAVLAAGQPKAALVAFDRAVAGAPALMTAHLGRADAWLALRDPARAAMAFAAARALAPTRGDLAWRHGVALRQAGDIDAARAAFRDATTFDRRSSGAWFALGLVEQEKGDAGAAVLAYRRALEARPDYHEAALNLGVACQDAGDLDGAMEAYKIALRAKPDSFGRIVHALTCGPTGGLWLDLDALRRRLST
jgi:tetratricopeptide (TPR) repeat protein